jgi:hypothetical protein
MAGFAVSINGWIWVSTEAPRRLRAADRRGHVLSRSGCSDRRVVVAGPRQRNHPDFPLRGFVRCEACGRPLTGSWSKGRNGHYAYYHCQRQWASQPKFWRGTDGSPSRLRRFGATTFA